ncbi:YdeI/OmpD-associated family protein [Chryseolinea lacunae]|uniref:DUF1905 domain-containing protein n=1 Tax=Chryseolinea lacunae TaxID=2801331 RepID=A0ABS1KRS2_9BACT|nr:YdeI/OmpD-associated family protein [Chryseolinea lacunae]MBL0742170.1 DUF1905 domain-containing protein [Chryseolinea lacunae]
MNKTLAAKLKIKSSHTSLVLNAPPKHNAAEGLRTKAQAGMVCDFVMAFVKTKRELDALVPKALKALAPDGLLWISYPKKSSGLKTDLTRDRGWDMLTGAGYEPVSVVAVDDTWSALRFRLKTKIPVSTRQPKPSAQQQFTATLEKPGDINGAYVTVPFDVKELYGTGGLVKVNVTFDGHPYRGVLSPMGKGRHIIIVRKDICDAIGKKAGDTVKVTLAPDTAERTVAIPKDLQDAFGQNSAAKTFFDTLSYTNRKEYVVWITSAKKKETRTKRLSETVARLHAGKKNPSEK